MILLRRWIPLTICFLMGVSMALQYYIPHEYSGLIFEELNTRWLIIIIGFSLILGLVSVIQVHYRRIRRRESGWGYSLVMFLGLAVMVLAGIISAGSPETTALHIATALASDVEAGEATITVAKNIPAEAVIDIGSGLVVERHTITSVSGTEPFTLKLSAPLAHAHVTGVKVRAEIPVQQISTSLVSDEPSGATTISIADRVPNGAVISIGQKETQDTRRVAAISGTGPYLVTLDRALRWAHPSGKEVRGQPLTTPFGWMYNYGMVPLQATMFSILAFFIASAAFRAFRARSVNAALLLIAAVIVMFGQVTLGEAVGRLVGMSPGSIVLWIMVFPNTAAQRAIILGVALGVIATSLKIIFGIERAYLGEGE